MLSFGEKPLVPLKLEDFLVYVEDNKEMQLLKSHKMNSPLNKELFNTIVSVLRSPLLEWTSNSKPTPLRHSENTDGVMYLFTNYSNYLEDGIDWKGGKQMLKVILFDEDSKTWKLKNGGERGVPKLRRQTWMESAGQSKGKKGVSKNEMDTSSPEEEDTSWRRHEYRLFEGDKRKVSDWPVLIHYFRKRFSPSQTLHFLLT